MNIRRQFQSIAELIPDKTAMISSDGELKYEEFYNLTDRYAHALKSLGVEPGDRYNLVMTNSNRMMAIIVAGWQIGAIPAPINIRLNDETIQLLIEDSGANIAIVDEPLTEKQDAMEVIDNLTVVRSGTQSELENHLPSGNVDTEIEPRLDHEDALFLHTAGTTGRPKWVRLSHGNLESSRGVLPGAGLDSSDVGLHYFPLYHSGGIDLTVTRLLNGATIIIGSGWNPEDALQYVADYPVNGITLVPQMGYEMINHDAIDDYDLSSVEYIWVGGDTVSEELAASFRDIGAQPIQGYGLTETMAVISVRGLGETACPLDSTGRPINDIVNIKVIDPNTGQDVSTGEVGEIMITGDKVCSGYHNRPEEEEEAFDDGWLHTDDLGMIDDSGYLYITGRLDNMMIVGGENVYPTDVENTLEMHPAIAQAVVVAAPDERKGQIPVANIVLEEGENLSEDELKQWFIEEDAAFKHPRKIRFLNKLPKTAIGKIDRQHLMDEVADSAA